LSQRRSWGQIRLRSRVRSEGWSRGRSRLHPSLLSRLRNQLWPVSAQYTVLYLWVFSSASHSLQGANIILQTLKILSAESFWRCSRRLIGAHLLIYIVQYCIQHISGNIKDSIYTVLCSMYSYTYYLSTNIFRLKLWLWLQSKIFDLYSKNGPGAETGAVLEKIFLLLTPYSETI
jgi:hypothetical protein